MLGGADNDSHTEAGAAASSSSPLSTTSAERRAAHRNSLIYEASGANKLMESELLRLRGELRESDLGASVLMLLSNMLQG
jgi:hypothetical protein